jgi:hypothetical protein
MMKRYFFYLDELRENMQTVDWAGQTLTFGKPGPSKLMACFGLEKEEAIAVFKAWSETFEETKTLDECVALAEASREKQPMSPISKP